MDALFVAVGLDETMRELKLCLMLFLERMIEVSLELGVDMVEEILCLGTEMVGEE